MIKAIFSLKVVTIATTHEIKSFAKPNILEWGQ
jgi:hypothetical protein